MLKSFKSHLFHRLPAKSSVAPWYLSLTFKRCLSTHACQPSLDQVQQKGEPAQSGNFQSEILKINQLLSSIDKLAKVAKSSHYDLPLEKYVHRKLSAENLQVSSRHIVLDKVITLLISHRFYDQAAGVYQRMISEGFVASDKTTAKMAAVIYAVSSETHEELISLLDETFANPAYDEASLRELVELFEKLEFSPKLTQHIITRFIDARGSGYTPSNTLLTQLAAIQGRAGMFDAALSWLARPEPSNPEVIHVSSKARGATHPYAAFITAVSRAIQEDKPSIDEILLCMQKAEISPDASIFNSLIALELRQRSLQKVFSLYRVLRQLSQERSIMPDAFTFGSLFTALHRLHRTRRSRMYKRPSNVVPPRELYREMFACHLISTCSRPFRPSPVVTLSVMNVVLRAFLSKQDYPGAFVVIRAFTLCGFKPDVKTYSLVIKHLMKRVQNDTRGIRNSNHQPWADRFFGVDSWAVVKNSDLVASLVEKALAFGSQTCFELTGDIEPDSSEEKYAVPTMSMICGRDVVSSERKFDIVPLERILRRAILAEVGGELLMPNESLSPAKRVSEAISDAKKEMVPSGIVIPPPRRINRKKYQTKAYVI